MIEFLKEEILKNDFLSGGFLLMVLGLAMTYLRYVPKHILKFIEHRFIFNVTIDKAQLGFNKHVYSKVMYWLSTKTALSNKRDYYYFGYNIIDDNNQFSHTFFIAPGKYLIRYCKRWVLVIVHNEMQEVSNNATNGSEPLFHKFINLKFISFDKKKGKKFFEEIIEKEEREEVEKFEQQRLVGISTTQDGKFWGGYIEKEMRSFNSLIFDKKIETEILKDIDWFLNSEEWYKKLGIPYRRGYLLFGEPGNGKTSFIHAIASKYRKRIYLINLNEISNDQDLQSLIMEVKRDSILVIEDIDCVERKKINREKTEATTFIQTEEKGISLSGLLNILDGFLTPENGNLLFLTTNHKNNLDKALIRPGRIDRQINIKNASYFQIEEMFKRFFPDSAEKSKEFAYNLVEYENSMAELQGYFMQYTDANQAIANCKELIKPAE